MITPDYRVLKRTKSLADAALEFKRDFYLKTSDEMHRDWVEDPDGLTVSQAIKPALPEMMQEAIDAEFEDHNPFWWYIHDIVYAGDEFNIDEKKMVNMAEFRLHPPLHRDIICKKILEYMVERGAVKSGLAVFITRYGLKTFIGCIGLASFLLTRHRIVFNDYTTIRIIHDVEDEAIVRSGLVKKMHLRNKLLKGLYPEVCLPGDKKWMTEANWDLMGRAEEGKEDVDRQISALGIRSATQGRHPMYTIIDDVESVRHMDSEAAVRETKTYFQGFQYSEQIGLSRRVLLGTYYNPASVHATIAENAEAAERGEIDPRAAWEVVTLPGIVDEGKETEHALYPTRLGVDVLEQLRQQEIVDHGNDLNWRMQIMLDFKSSSSTTFDMHMWRTVNLIDPATEGDERIIEAMKTAPTFIQCDFAGKNQQSSGKGDYNAIWVVKYPLINGQLNRVIVDGYMDKTSTIEQACQKSLEMASLYDAWWIVAEEAVAHKMVGDMLNKVSSRMGLPYYLSYQQDGKPIGNIITLVPRATGTRGMAGISGWKMARIDIFANDFNAGKVWFNTGMDYQVMVSLKAQMSSFPHIKKDDLIDALTMADDEKVRHKIPAPRTSTAVAARRAPKRKQRQGYGRMKYTGMVLR